MKTLLVIDINCHQCGKRIRVRASSEENNGVQEVMCWNCSNTVIRITVQKTGNYAVQRRILRPVEDFKYVNRYAFKVWRETK